jgi:ribosomal protein S18 acetylase RimI-like enzyme
MDLAFEIVEATPDDAAAIADIHLTARRVAMPYLARPHTDDETRVWFAGCVCDRPATWWVARQGGRVVGYMLIDGEDLDHLYVHPDSQGRGVGTALLRKALSLSPRRVVLATSQRNTRARAFYEKHGFRATHFTEGENEEREPDVHYAWEPPQ